MKQRIVEDTEREAVFDAYIKRHEIQGLLPDPRGGTKFSVVIPAYNEGDIVERTLNSFLVQTRKDFEVILVDNASTDQTADVIKRFIEAHPEVAMYYLYQPKKGAGNARKMGMDQAVYRSNYGKGIGFILCTDADTVLPTNWVEIVAGTAESNQADIIAGEVSYFDDLENPTLDFIDRAKRYLSRNLITQTLGSNLTIAVDAYVAIDGTKQYYKPDGSLAYGEDTMMVENLLKMGRELTLTGACVKMDPRRYLINLLQGADAKSSVYTDIFDDVRGSLELKQKIKEIPEEYFELFKDRLMKSQFKRHVVKVYLDVETRKQLWEKARILVQPKDSDLIQEIEGHTLEQIDLDQLWTDYKEVFLNNLERLA